MRKADVYFRDMKAGQLAEDENGYLFSAGLPSRVCNRSSRWM